jgi:hypothetical protein
VIKPVVSSLVALAIAIAPLAAVAGEKATHGKPVAHKIVKHKKASKEDKPIVVTVKHVIRKPGKAPPKHASGVDFGGDHPEPKLVKVAHMKSGKIEAPKANKKSAKEKGHKKATKKADDAPSDGQAERDEDFADLVARIRGISKGKTKTACSKDPVEIVRGPEIDRFELTTCDGAVAPEAIERLSVLVRPGTSPRPIEPFADLAKKTGPDLALGIKRVDRRLVERLQSVVDKFTTPGNVAKMSIISGYRPSSVGSMHASGRAIDFRLEGAKNEDVVAFCKTLNDTGCGYYPNSSFVHIDVRDVGTGHVTWIDASGAGESPRYVDKWPPAAPQKPIERASAPLLDREAMPEPVDSHPPLPPPTPAQ